MTQAAAKRQRKPASVPTDEELIRRCLDGDAHAWAGLIDKYKNLIYSIPIKLGMYEDAGDIFQTVCASLLAKLSQLRDPGALPKWLMQTCYHECLQHQQIRRRHVELDLVQMQDSPATEILPEQAFAQFQEEQMLREALAEMPARCGRLIRMLFFENPPRPYEEIAKTLGLAEGSIGFIRGRCLTRLRKHLEDRGF